MKCLPCIYSFINAAIFVQTGIGSWILELLRRFSCVIEQNVWPSSRPLQDMQRPMQDQSSKYMKNSVKQSNSSPLLKYYTFWRNQFWSTLRVNISATSSRNTFYSVKHVLVEVELIPNIPAQGMLVVTHA